MNQRQTHFGVMASAAILVLTAVTGESINVSADASPIQPSIALLDWMRYTFNLSPTRREALKLAPFPSREGGWGLGLTVLHSFENRYISQRIAQSRRAINEKSALNAVWQLRQVQQKVQRIKRLSNGKVRVGLRVDSSPTTAEPYYAIQLFEDHGDRITTLDWFHVSTQGAVTVLDAVTGEYIPSTKWKP